jgi:hypothetical protein
MRKNLFSFLALAFVISLTSCGGGGGGFEGDVRKMANYRCDLQKLMAQESPDTKKIEDLQKKMGEFADKMSKKYEKDKDNEAMEEKAEKIMDEVMEKCK